MEILSFLRKRLFVPHTVPASPCSPPIGYQVRLREALLKCATLTEAEVDAYIDYEFEGITCELVPFDYGLEHPDADISYLYSDSVLELAILRRHTNQIEPETLEKVRRVLPVVSLHSRDFGR